MRLKFNLSLNPVFEVPLFKNLRVVLEVLSLRLGEVPFGCLFNKCKFGVASEVVFLLIDIYIYTYIYKQFRKSLEYIFNTTLIVNMGINNIRIVT